MALKVTFITDDYDDNPDDVLDKVSSIGGYDVEVEEHEPTPAPKGEPKRPKRTTWDPPGGPA